MAGSDKNTDGSYTRRDPAESSQPVGEAASRPAQSLKQQDAEWGFEPAKSGMATEAKMGMGVVVILVCAFGFLVYHKFDLKQKALQAAAIAAQQGQPTPETAFEQHVTLPQRSQQPADFFPGTVADPAPQTIQSAAAETLREPRIAASIPTERPFDLTDEGVEKRDDLAVLASPSTPKVRVFESTTPERDSTQLAGNHPEPSFTLTEPPAVDESPPEKQSSVFSGFDDQPFASTGTTQPSNDRFSGFDEFPSQQPLPDKEVKEPGTATPGGTMAGKVFDRTEEVDTPFPDARASAFSGSDERRVAKQADHDTELLPPVETFDLPFGSPDKPVSYPQDVASRQNDSKDQPFAPLTDATDAPSTESPDTDRFEPSFGQSFEAADSAFSETPPVTDSDKASEFTDQLIASTEPTERPFSAFSDLSEPEDSPRPAPTPIDRSPAPQSDVPFPGFDTPSPLPDRPKTAAEASPDFSPKDSFVGITSPMPEVNPFEDSRSHQRAQGVQSPAVDEAPFRLSPFPSVAESSSRKSHAPSPPMQSVARSTVIQQVAASSDVDIVDVGSDDTYWTISKRVYGTARYFSGLALFNQHRIPDPKKLRPGMKVLIPAPDVLESQYPELYADLKRSQNSQPSGYFLQTNGTPAYRVGERETLSEISQRHLGRASRWVEIQRANPVALRDPNRLKPGIVLILPDDATDVHIIP